MAVPGKKGYLVYLDEENTDYVRSFLTSGKYSGGLSGLLDAHIGTMAKTLKASKYKKDQKLTAAKAFKVFMNGLKQEPL